MSVYRFDAATIAPLAKTPAGYLRVPGKLTRIGIFPYTQPDGSIRRELRAADEVFHADSLDSLRLVPVTKGHPPFRAEGQQVASDIARDVMRGAVGDTVAHDDQYVTATVGVVDQELIEAIERGESELSCGYTCELDMTPGEWNGEKYDAKQTHIRYNHLAVVPRGRAGHDVALKLDSADKTGGRMAVIKVAGKDFEVAQEVADAFNAQASANEALAGKAKADAADRDVQKARADAAEAVAKEAPKVTELVKARVALEREAAEIITVEKMDEMEDVAIKTQVVKALLPSMNLEGQSADYVNVAYAAALAARPSKSADGLAAARGAGQRSDGKTPQQQMIERQANAWKGKAK